MKRILAILLAFTVLLVGCSSAEEIKPVTITVWTYYNGAQLTAFNALVDEFNETVGHEKGIKVESYSQGSVGDLETNVLNSAQNKVGADKVPNIFAAYADTAYAVDQLGLVVNLSEYYTDKELSEYIDGYIEEGRFGTDGSLKIFPVAKSAEVFMLNYTDWKVFAEATGASVADFSTIEGLTEVARKYYEWTDGQTPDIPNDGKAFYGRDAMANYMIIGSMQLGHEIFKVKNGVMYLDFNKKAMRQLWDNYYVPFIKGYFASSGRFRSDDVKTGNIIAYTGSSSSATFFPEQVILSDEVFKPIEMRVFKCPQFKDGSAYAVQQGAGMVVTKASDEEIMASVEFLKWFTQNEQDIGFAVGSGYMPVRRDANDISYIAECVPDISQNMKDILTAAIQTVDDNILYTPKAFERGSDARKILEYSMSDIATADRAVVKENLEKGMTLEEAVSDFVTDEHFDKWYYETLESLKAYT